jgi:hypothetical protein
MGVSYRNNPTPDEGGGKGKAYGENATVLERLQWYGDNNMHDKGRALAKLADYLEECFLWEIEFRPQ